MNYSKIENNMVYYKTEQDNWRKIDEISKEDILLLLNEALSIEDFNLVEPKKEDIKNEAHYIIYKNIYDDFDVIMKDKNKFLDKSRERYKDIIEEYNNK